MVKPSGIIQLEDELTRIVNESVSEGKTSIDLKTASRICGMDEQCFRESCYRGTNPVAIGGRHSSNGKTMGTGFGRVPLLRLWNYLNGSVTDISEREA